MAKNIHIIYIPGLSDRYDPLRSRLLRLWRYRGVITELVPMRWESDESLEAKYARVEAAMSHAAGRAIVLIGESAGGSITMAMYEKHAERLYAVVTICGKNQGVHNVSPYLYRKNPAFQAAMIAADDSIKRLARHDLRRFISVHPLYDPVVSVRETLLPDCREVRLWSYGHFVPIIHALTVSSWRIIRTIKAES